MEPLLETIDLDVEEPSELLFRVKVEGADPAPAKVRLVCESGDVAFMFNGRTAGADGLVQFNMPVMKDKLREGLYQSRVEVLIENRYFAPVQFQINFKKAVKVVAEAVNVAPSKAAPEIRVSAAPVVAAPKPAPVMAPKPAPVVAQPAVPAKKTAPAVREAPPPARVNAQMTLRERYSAKNDEILNESISDLDEDKILEVAQTFVKSRLDKAKKLRR